MSSHVPTAPFDQAWNDRKAPMAQLIRSAFDRPVSLLEIGSWCGLGSTQVWLNNVVDGSSVTLFDAWRPYASDSDLKSEGGSHYMGMDLLISDAFLSTYVAIRRFEAECQSRNINVQLIRADSARFLPNLSDESFDFIYVDGDHKYSKAKSDIRHAKRLLKSGYGIICGDDLERLPTSELVDLAKTYTDRDYLSKPHNFHPGVLLAVAEEFDDVSAVNGFWWVVCRNGVFTKS